MTPRSLTTGPFMQKQINGNPILNSFNRIYPILNSIAPRIPPGRFANMCLDTLRIWEYLVSWCHGFRLLFSVRWCCFVWGVWLCGVPFFMILGALGEAFLMILGGLTPPWSDQRFQSRFWMKIGHAKRQKTHPLGGHLGPQNAPKAIKHRCQEALRVCIDFGIEFC